MSLYLTPQNIIAAAAGLVVIIFLIWIIRLEVKLRKAFMGRNASSLEDAFDQVRKQLLDLTQFTREMEVYLETVERRVKRSTQSIETIRFNPFKGTGDGGNNSFSSAFLNQHGNGIVLTSLYARDRVSMFAKAVKHFKSESDLSEEEVEAIEKAKQALAQ